jgi:hypothetical protein
LQRDRCGRPVADCAAVGTPATLSLIGQSADDDRRGDGHHWVTTWATSPATFFAYTPQCPPAFPTRSTDDLGTGNIQPISLFLFPNALF